MTLASAGVIAQEDTTTDEVVDLPGEAVSNNVDAPADATTSPVAEDGPAASDETVPADPPESVDTIPATDAADTGDSMTGDDLVARHLQAHQRFMMLYDEERYPQALFVMTQVISMTRELYGENSLEMTAALTNLARVQQRVGDLPAAQANYTVAISLIDDLDGILSPKLINPLIGLGGVYNDMRSYDRGLQAYQRALRISHVNGGFYNLEQLRVRDGLTESYLGLDDFEEADFEQQVQVYVYQREYGDESVEILPALYKLGDWYERSGQIENEQLLYQQTLRMIRRAEGKNSETLIEAYRRFAASYRRMELPDESVRYMKKAIDINEAQPEPDLVLRGDLLVELGDMYITFGHSRNAVSTYTEAWDVFSANEDTMERRELYFDSPKRVLGILIPDVYPRKSKNGVNPDANPEAYGDGLILAKYTVTARGRVEDIVIIESDPPDLLDDKLMSALRRSYYRPEFRDGEPVAVTDMSYRHEFKYELMALRDQVEEEKESDKLPSPFETDAQAGGKLPYPEVETASD